MKGMTTKGIQPVILCGGGGTRLWPRSRRAKPKPFLPLLGERTLFQQALDRVGERGTFAPPIVVAGEAHVPLVRKQGGGDLSIIAEPTGRNTAPAIALATPAQRLSRRASGAAQRAQNQLRQAPRVTFRSRSKMGTIRDCRRERCYANLARAPRILRTSNTTEYP